MSSSTAVPVEVILLPEFCYRCGQVTAPVVGLRWTRSRCDGDDREVVGDGGMFVEYGHESADVIAGACSDEVLEAHGAGPLRWRRTRQAPDGYLANTCHHCGAVLGNWPLHEALVEYQAEGGTLDNIVDEGCFTILLDFMRSHPEYGMAQPLVRSMSNPDRIYSSGHHYTEDHWCRPLETVAPADVRLNLPSCSISSTIIRSDMLARCGLLDPIYQIYYESADLSFRARREGYRCACVAEAVSYNEGTDAQGLDSIHHRYFFNRNRLIFWSIHDAAVYAEIAQSARQTLAVLEEELERTEWGLGPEREPIRRGIADGLRVAESGVPRAIPALGDFDKTRVLVVRQV